MEGLEKYGWAGVIVYFLIRDVFPPMRDWALRKQKTTDRVSYDQAMAVIHEEQASRQAERESRAEDREFRHKIDERSVEAMEKLADAVHVMAINQASLSERVNQMLRYEESLSAFMVASVTAMKETVGRIHPMPVDIPPIVTPSKMIDPDPS